MMMAYMVIQLISPLQGFLLLQYSRDGILHRHVKRRHILHRQARDDEHNLSYERSSADRIVPANEEELKFHTSNDQSFPISALIS